MTNLIKWAGGKAKLAPLFKEFAVFSQENFYVEPFLGGGGSFLQLKGEYAVASDKNPSLIALWELTRDDIESLISRYDYYHHLHNAKNYKIARSEYNQLNRNLYDNRVLPELKKDVAGVFLYLLKTCFNGLCRYNLKGEFNTPIGDKLPTVEAVRERLLIVQDKIKSTNFHHWDFEKTIKHYQSKSNAFFYCDPPYSKVNAKGFQGYIEGWFDTDADRLAQSLIASGCDFAVSEIDCPAVRSRYAGYPIIELQASRSIGGNRSKVNEVLILSRL